MTISDEEVAKEVDSLDDKPVAVTLAFKDWGQLVGALTAMVDMLNPDGTLVGDVHRWCAVIRGQVTGAALDSLTKEAANEDAN